MAGKINVQNLKPNSERTAEQVKALTRKGGIASGESRRRAKSMREWAKALGKMPIDTRGLKGEAIEADYAGAVVLEQYRKAIEGNPQSAKFIAELLGEMVQVQKIDHSGVVVQVSDKELAKDIAAAINND